LACFVRGSRVVTVGVMLLCKPLPNESETTVSAFGSNTGHHVGGTEGAVDVIAAILLAAGAVATSDRC